MPDPWELRMDAVKLRVLADYFDAKDFASGNTDNRVQSDLRRIADYILSLAAR